MTDKEEYLLQVKSEVNYRFNDFIDMVDKAYELGHAKGETVGKFDNRPQWYYCKDKLPPNPIGDNGNIKPLTYICVYKLNNEYDDYEVSEFDYIGNGEWLGENKEYPIYAWFDFPMDIPRPRKE